MRTLAKWILAGVVGTFTTAAQADWPQYRGPAGNGHSTEKMVASWPSAGPKVLWKANVNPSMGSFAIKDGRAFYLSAEDGNESAHAIDMKTGGPVWTTPIGPTQARSAGNGGSGPGSTPVIEGDKIYLYGSKLMLMCLNAADGKVLWKHDVQKDFNGQAENARAISTWGSTSSPIIEGDLVIVQGGGAEQHYLAFNKNTGNLAWKKHTEILTQSTPAAATIHGVRQVIFLQQSGLVSIDPKTGDTLWKQPYSEATAIAPSPVVSDDIIYVSIGYNVGGAAFQISKDKDNKFTSKQLWRTPGQSMNWWSTAVIKDGYIYGIHGRGNDRNAPLQCIDLKTGKLMWSGPPAGGGEILVVDGKLIVQAGTGKLHLVQPDPTGYKEISTAQPLSGQAWGWPAFSKGVFVYRTLTEAVALDLSTQ